MKPVPPLNYIRSFECAARHLSFTLAADELGYTQAAVSNHIRMLEQYLGGALFQRFARSLALTDIGEAFLPTLRQAIAQIDAATDGIRSVNSKLTVVVTCPVSLAEGWLAESLAKFRLEYPEIDAVVNGTVWETPLQPIADVAITVNRDDEVSEGAVRLWRDDLTLVAAPSFFKGKRQDALLRELRSAETVLIHGRHENWEIMADALGITKLAIERGVKTNTSNIALGLAAKGLGYTITVRRLARPFIDRGLLVEPLEVRPVSPWSYYIRTLHTRKNYATRIFSEWVLSSARGEERPEDA